MLKFIVVVWQMWCTIRPIYKDLMRIIHEVNSSDLQSDDARKKVFQDITDTMQARGLQSVPDSVLNCSIELCYQVYQWKLKKGGPDA